MRAVRFLQIEPTTRCNFTCAFCAGRSMPQGDIEPATFQSALDSFPELEHVELQGEGEPLLHPRFFEMVGIARRRGVRVSFITNGSLLDPGTVDRILDAGVERVLVSIESPDPEEFRAIRGGRLEKVVGGVEALLAARTARDLARPAVGFAVTVLKGTRARFGEIQALYERLGMDGGFTVQPLQRMASYALNYDAGTAAQCLSDEETEDLWLDLLRHRRLRHRQVSASGFYDQLLAGWRPGRRRCPWLDGGLYVDRDGEAAPCCMVKDTSRYGLGRVGRDPAAAILERRESLRRELARGRTPEPCAACEIARNALLSRRQLLRLGWRAWRRRSAA